MGGFLRLVLMLSCSAAGAAHASGLELGGGWALLQSNPSKVQNVVAAPAAALRAGLTLASALEGGLSISQATFFNRREYISARSLAADLRLNQELPGSWSLWISMGFGWNFMAHHFSNWDGRWDLQAHLGLDYAFNARWDGVLQYGGRLFSPWDNSLSFQEMRIGLRRRWSLR